MFKKSSRVLLVTLLLFVLAGTTYAFAAENTVADSYAGDGQGDISGYNVSEIHYTISGDNITNVTFKLDATAINVRAAISTLTTAGTLETCTATSTLNEWTCPMNSTVPILTAEFLRVVAFD